LNKETLEGRRRPLPKSFDTSSKSPAYTQYRKNFRARAGKPAAGFFDLDFLNRTAAAMRDATSSLHAL
jgi:hypothetical protein